MTIPKLSQLFRQAVTLPDKYVDNPEHSSAENLFICEGEERENARLDPIHALVADVLDAAEWVAGGNDEELEQFDRQTLRFTMQMCRTKLREALTKLRQACERKGNEK